MDVSGREYFWLLERLKEVQAGLATDPYDMSLIKEKIAINKELPLRTIAIVAIHDGEETEVSRWRNEEDCKKSAQLKGYTLGTEYPVTGSDKTVRYVTKQIA